MSRDEEINDELHEHKKKPCMIVERKDFEHLLNQEESKYSTQSLYKSPIFDDLRYQMAYDKLSRGTGINPRNFRILKLNISDINVDICWLTLENERQVQKMFQGAAYTMLDKFNIFPAIPEKAVKRRKKFEEYLKEQQEIEPKL